MAECFELTEFNNSITECRVSNHGVHLNGSLNKTLVPGMSDITDETGKLKNQDFFTKCNVSGTKTKSKRSKRKRNASKDLMDVVNSELRVLENPIMKNIVNTIDYTKFDQNFHIYNNYSRGFSLSRIRRFHYGNTSMNPVFPSIYEDFTPDNAILVQYIPSSQITNLASKNEENGKQDVKFLDMELCNIKIKHHHNFFLEELLMTKLLEIYDEYKIIQSKLNLCIRTTKVNRETKNNLKEKLLKVSSKKENVLFDSTFRKYVKKLLDSKNELLDLTKKNKEIINKIVSLWSDIKMVQEKTGIIRTIYDMNITKNVLDEDEYQQKWKDAYDQEIIDITDKIEYDFVTKYIEYKQEKYENKNDKNITVHKPKLVVDDHIVNECIERVLDKIVCREEIELNLKSNEKLKNKKNMRTSTSYKFMILVDDNFVCESDNYINNDKFVVDFVESYSIQILPHNKNLTINLLENDHKCASHTISLSEIKMGIQNTDKKKIEFQCNSRIEPNTKNVGSGCTIKEIASASGVRLKSSNLFKDQLYTKYEVNLHMGWSGELDENNTFEIKKYVNISQKINKLLNTNKKTSFDILKDVIEHIYEKDAGGDLNLIQMLKEICDTEIPFQNAEFTIENNDLERLKLLHLRNNNNSSNVKMIPLISTEISTKQLNFLKNMGKSDPDNAYFESIKKSNLDPIEIQRYIGFKYIANLNQKITKKCNDKLMKKTYRDVVCNFKDLCLRSILHEENNSMALDSTNGIGQFLNQSQMSIKEQELLIVIHRAFNLPDRTKSILSDESLDEDDSEHVAGVKIKSLRTFVRVTYKENCVQTTTAIGCYPSWNETLRINIKDGSSNTVNINLYDKVKETVSEDFPEENSSLHSRIVQYKYCNKWLGSLQIPLNAVLSTGKLQGTFKINTPSIILGYENTADHKSTSQSSASEISRCVKDSAFLSLQIYAKFVSNTNKYSRPAMNNDDDYIIKHLNEFIINYCKDFPNRNLILTYIDSSGQNKCVTQFLQPIIPPDWACFPKNPTRLESALSKTSAFSKSSSSNQGKTENEEKREIDVERAESTTPSYGRASDYWATEREIERMTCCCLRYVSLIPTYDVENYDVTLMGADLLKILHGSPLDHSLLLASYFLYLGIKCWVVFGSSLRGLSSYVLVKCNTKNNKILQENDYINDKSSNKWFSRREVNSWFILDALTAEKYEIRDISCPLKTIYYAFNNENIWVNIQSTIACETISLDFSKSSEWQAVFDKSIFVASPTIISDKNIYTPATNVEALREKLEAKIKLKVQKWRARTKTVWNRYCSALLRELVPQLESWAFNPNEPKPSLGQRLKQLMVTYKVYGFPLNMPFVNMKTIFAAVKSTALHMHDDPTVEFGLAVEMFPYPNNVISVWVFFVSITKM